MIDRTPEKAVSCFDKRTWKVCRMVRGQVEVLWHIHPQAPLNWLYVVLNLKRSNLCRTRSIPIFPVILIAIDSVTGYVEKKEEKRKKKDSDCYREVTGYKIYKENFQPLVLATGFSFSL